MKLALMIALVSTPAEVEDVDTSGPAKPADEHVEVDFTYGGVGYQGSLFEQRRPGGSRVSVDRHGVELLGGGANAASERSGKVAWFHSELGRGGVFLGSTPDPELNAAASASGAPEPRNGFNFGIFGTGRANGGVAFGRRCGFAMSLRGGGSLKAYTRSTIPGNHLIVDGGVAGGLHCHVGSTFVLAQWGGQVNFGVEQIQDVRYQQGNDNYDPGRGNGLVFFPAQGPSTTVVHAGERIDAALSGQVFWSFGRGRYGGQRFGARVDAAVAFRLRNEGIGFAPWYQLDRVEYGASSEVDDPNTRLGHTFGVSIVYSRRGQRSSG